MRQVKIYIATLITSLLIIMFPSTINAKETEIILPILEDTYIESVKFDEVHGTLQSLLLGFANTWREGLTRTYLKYDIYTIQNITNGNIVSATLHLFQNRINTDNPYAIKVGIVSNPWSEDTLMWTPYPLTDYDSIEEREIPPLLGWKSIDISSIITRQLENIESNHGIVLLMQDEEARGGSFWSKDCILHTTLCTSENFPYLSIVYEEEEEIVEAEDCEEDAERGDIEEKEEIIEEAVEKAQIEEKNTVEAPSAPVKEKKEVKEVVAAPEASSINTKTVPELSNEVGVIPSILGTATREIEKISQNMVIDNSKDTITCNYKYYIKSNKVVRSKCTLPSPTISKATTIKGILGNTVEATVAVPRKLRVTLDTIHCLKPTLSKPITFLKCIEYVRKSERIEVNIKYTDIQLLIDGKWVDTHKKAIKEGYVTYHTSYNAPKKLNISARYISSTSLKTEAGKWLDMFEVSNKSKEIKVMRISSKVPPYSFPHSTVVNVTQWHGKTAYDNNHTGIDLESRFLPVISLSNGKVEYIGWDNASGKCISGGNYIKIRHTDGRYSVYLHLKSFSKELKKGSDVKKGQVIGVSGSSGYYNCEKLSAHLHFEVRNGSKQSSHTNPVPLINTDWRKIKTARSNIYPGRLTGNNPHPTY